MYQTQHLDVYPLVSQSSLHWKEECGCMWDVCWVPSRLRMLSYPITSGSHRSDPPRGSPAPRRPMMTTSPGRGSGHRRRPGEGAGRWSSEGDRAGSCGSPSAFSCPSSRTSPSSLASLAVGTPGAQASTETDATSSITGSPSARLPTGRPGSRASTRWSSQGSGRFPRSPRSTRRAPE
jgi:hypothetical protein